VGRKSSPDESPTYDHGRGEGRWGSSNGKKTTRVGLGAGGVEENRGEFIPAPLVQEYVRLRLWPNPYIYCPPSTLKVHFFQQGGGSLGLKID